MKRSWKFAVAMAIACWMGKAPVMAQEAPIAQAAQPYQYYTVADAPMGAGVAQQPMVPAPQAAAGACQTCETEEEETCDPWRLFECHENCHGIKTYGYFNAGYTYNFHNPASRFNGPVTFNDRDDGQMNGLYTTIEKALDAEQCGWQLGGRVDFLYGTDARFTKALGLELNQDGTDRWNNGRFYQLAMPQAYAELGNGDLSIKLGHFYTIIGYEVVPANGNFFYSHAYTMQYGEPFTHTGALATYKYSENTTLYGGAVLGWDNFEDTNDHVSFLGGITWTNGDDLTVAFAGISGHEPTGFGGTDIRNMYSLVVTYKINDCWTYVLQHDNAWQEGGADGGTADAQWYGLNQYLFRTINDCWKFGVRAEVFRDDDGVRVAALPSGNPIGLAAGSYYGITAGFNYTPSANMTIRPEVRYDWTNAGDQYDDNTRGSQILAGIDFIYLW